MSSIFIISKDILIKKDPQKYLVYNYQVDRKLASKNLIKK